MKTRIREVIHEDSGKPRYICEYKWLLWWLPCNTILTNLPYPSYRNGYHSRKEAEGRIKDFLAGID